MTTAAAATLETVSTFAEFRHRVRHPRLRRLSCRLVGELALPFAEPDPMRLLAEAVADPEARILRQARGDRIWLDRGFAAEARAMPLEQLARQRDLHVTLFALDRLFAPGAALAGLREAAIAPFECRARDAGLAWEGGVWPILFISGAAASTNYHIDPMPTYIRHLFGAKRFHGLVDPDAWCPEETRRARLEGEVEIARPAGIAPGDCVVHDNRPGDVVWAPAVTPHWVDAMSLSATLTLAFRRFDQLTDAAGG